jgi:phthiocerol/phenolphthiocerol synthesis type-I polyketide synthase E
MSKADNLNNAIAVIGMAGRFPQAKNLDAFWQNLEQGVESIRNLSDEELLAAGIAPEALANPLYVKRRAVLEDVELFDATFFGYTPREAEIMDPQHRIFLECAWEAFENAGYNPENPGATTGVYAGCGMNTYLLANLISNRDILAALGGFQTVLGNDKDHLAMRVSYKLNLTGPSLTVQTACSTSLVAVHLACQSLLSGESDMALAGGISITVPQIAGYLYQEGGVTSPDGRCRAFDARAQGTVESSGVGVVVLKRLEDALADGDHIEAIIRASAINNDGNAKVGYTAPSVNGQADVIAEALTLAGLEAEQISYVETHGTGTPLGDPVEIAALTQAYRADTDAKAFCAIGSVKTNVGHTGAAAGIAGLIKTIFALKRRTIPPSLHYEQPNPKIDFAGSPFYVNSRCSAWEVEHTPRRAGVSSFGIGGTNAHVIIEEASPAPVPADAGRQWKLLLLSAETEPALRAATENLISHFKRHPQLNTADAAYTTQVGRKAFKHRQMIVCRDLKQAVAALEQSDARRVFRNSQEDEQERAAVFMFPGQGAQQVQMGLGLYRSEKTFREQLDACSEMLAPELGLQLRDLLFPDKDKVEDAAQQLSQTLFTQTALFSVEYALAQLWISWGVRPVALAGHSIGEYVAACLAGVFSLEDALRLVARRGRLMQQMAPGAMLSVPLAEARVRAMLDGKLSVAAINAPSLCVVSGATDEIEALRERLAAEGIEARRLRVSHAFHSHMMEPAREPFAREVSKVKLRPPKIPLLSNLTGRWMTNEEATSAGYWAQHLCRTVRFSENVSELLKEPDHVLLEVGPGSTLSKLTRQHREAATHNVLHSLPERDEKVSDAEFVLGTLGKLWLAGVEIDWTGFYADEKRQRLSLPTYPFERRRYWIEAREQHITAGLSLPQAPPPVRVAEAVPESAQSSSLHPRPALPTLYTAPSNEIEQSIAAVWHELLGIDDIGVHDNFFELGGHSLMATQLISRIRETYPVELPVRSLFEMPTIAGLAELVETLLIEKLEAMSDSEVQDFKSINSK